MKQETKQYHAPQCRRLGTVQELTLQSSFANNDTPTGNNNSAYPPVS